MPQALLKEISKKGVSPKGLGQAKIPFSLDMSVAPDYAVLDTRMRRDIFGLHPKAQLTDAEYRVLQNKLNAMPSRTAYNYGKQWLPWEFGTGEKTDYSSLPDAMDRVNEFVGRAKDQAQQQGRPLGEVVQDMARQEPKSVLRFPDNPPEVTAHIGATPTGQVAERVRKLPLGAGPTDLKKAVPELWNFTKRAGVDLVGKPSVAGEVGPSGRPVVDLNVRGPLPAVRYTGAAWLAANPHEPHIVINYHGSGVTPNGAHGQINLGNLGINEARDLADAVSEHLDEGWHVKAVQQGKKAALTIVAPGADADELGGHLNEIRNVLAGAGHQVESMSAAPTRVEVIHQADVPEVIYGGPKGATLAREGGPGGLAGAGVSDLGGVPRGGEAYGRAGQEAGGQGAELGQPAGGYDQGQAQSPLAQRAADLLGADVVPAEPGRQLDLGVRQLSQAEQQELYRRGDIAPAGVTSEQYLTPDEAARARDEEASRPPEPPARTRTSGAPIPILDKVEAALDDPETAARANGYHPDLPGPEGSANPSQILGPNGRLLATVSRDSRPRGLADAVSAISRTPEGAAYTRPPSAETLERMPNLLRMASDSPDLQASLQRQAEENPQLFDKYRRGAITHQELVESLAPKLGMTPEKFLSTPAGKAFNEQELLVLRSAVVDKAADMARLSQDIHDKGGVGNLTPSEMVAAMSQMNDASRLQAIATGAASTTARTLNQQKILITQRMARALTGANEAAAAAADKARAAARSRRAERLVQSTKDLTTERQAAVRQARTNGRGPAEGKAPTGGKAPAEGDIWDRINKAYDELHDYRGMSLEQREEDFQKLQQQREANAAKRQRVLSDPEQLLSALQDELGGERKVFGSDRARWQKTLAQQRDRAQRAGELSGDEARTAGDIHAGQVQKHLNVQAGEARNQEQIAARREAKAWSDRQRVNERQVTQAQEILKAMGGKRITAKVLEEFVKVHQAGDPMATAKFMRSLQNVSGWDRVAILRYASMLSSSATHTAQGLGNALNTLVVSPTTHSMAAGVDAGRYAVGRAMGRDVQRTRYLGEVPQEMIGWHDGFKTGMREAGSILRDGINPRSAAVGDIEHQRPGFNMAQTWLGEKLPGWANTGTDRIMEGPLRALEAGDAVFRGAARGGATRSLATRQALQEGYRGEAMTSRIQQIMENLEEHPDLLDQADKMAARAVMQERRGETRLAPRGGLAGGLFQALFPFVRTPYNVAAQGLGMTPLGLAGVAESAAKGETGEAVDRAARALLGTAIMGGGYALGMNGALTGASPETDADRSTLPPGWQPWSFRVPTPGGQSTYVKYSQMGPVGVPLALSAMLAEGMKQGKGFDDPVQAMGRVGSGFGRYMADQTMLQGVNQLMDAISSPTSKSAQAIVNSLVGSYVPYGALQRQIERSTGLASRDPGVGVDGLLEYLRSQTLGAGGVRPKLNDLGQEVPSAQQGIGSFVSPAPYDIERDEPTLATLRSADVGIPQQQDTLNVTGQGSIPLTKDEQNQLAAERGRIIQQNVQAWANDPKFQGYTTAEKNRLLSRVVAQATEQTNRRFISDLSDADYNHRLTAKPGPQPYVIGAAA